MSDMTEIAEHYRDKGYAVIRQAFDPETILELKEESGRIYSIGIQHPGSYRDQNLYFDVLPEREDGPRALLAAQWISWISPIFEKHRTDQRYIDIFRALLGEDIKQVTQQIHWKPPGAGLTGFRFHQDVRFRDNIDAYKDIVNAYLNVGLAIDPAPRENGCLRVVPGSHKMGYLGLSDEGGALRQGQTAEAEFAAVGLDPASIVDLVMDPGDVAIWNQMTVHGSKANLSDYDRAFLISGVGTANMMERGEWLSRGGKAVPIGATPEICKYEDLRTRPGPFYVKEDWFDTSQ